MSKNNSNNENEILPGSSQPQDLGSISYKDTTNEDATQKTQSIETTSSLASYSSSIDKGIIVKNEIFILPSSGVSANEDITGFGIYSNLEELDVFPIAIIHEKNRINE